MALHFCFPALPSGSPALFFLAPWFSSLIPWLPGSRLWLNVWIPDSDPRLPNSNSRTLKSTFCFDSFSFVLSHDFLSPSLPSILWLPVLQRNLMEHEQLNLQVCSLALQVFSSVFQVCSPALQTCSPAPRICSPAPRLPKSAPRLPGPE